ncbi:unnamed protein product [Victoria cruziana]
MAEPPAVLSLHQCSPKGMKEISKAGSSLLRRAALKNLPMNGTFVSPHLLHRQSPSFPAAAVDGHHQCHPRRSTDVSCCPSRAIATASASTIGTHSRSIALRGQPLRKGDAQGEISISIGGKSASNSIKTEDWKHRFGMRGYAGAASTLKLTTHHRHPHQQYCLVRQPLRKGHKVEAPGPLLKTYLGNSSTGRKSASNSFCREQRTGSDGSERGLCEFRDCLKASRTNFHLKSWLSRVPSLLVGNQLFREQRTGSDGSEGRLCEFRDCLKASRTNFHLQGWLSRCLHFSRGQSIVQLCEFRDCLKASRTNFHLFNITW